VIVKGTKVEGVFSADPVTDPDAELIPEITFLEIMTRELGVMDATAISLCKDNDLPVIVLNIQRPGAVLRAARGGQVGTLISGEVRS
jgi:uridylate kinase